MEVFCIAKNSNDLLCNEQIKVSQVLVIGPNGEQMGVKNINDASNKIKSQNISVTSISGYTFNTGTPISAVYIGDTTTNYAIVTSSNIIIIRGLISLGSSNTGPARVYYI